MATWVVDLDGVVWLTGEGIPGSAAAVDRLRRAGHRVVFATNNSALTVAELAARLERVGIPTDPADVVSSAHAAAGLVHPGAVVLAVADPGVVEALEERGATVVDDGPADAVVVGWTRRFDFDRLTAATRAVYGGARLIGTNDDPTHPTPAGLIPGGGALLAAVATATGTVPEVAGKPHQPMADLILDRTGPVAMVVGDRPATDGLLAERLGAPFGLVLSGVTASADGVAAAVVADDLAHLVDALPETIANKR
ncbi:MAG TPA: HAD-IIA family hydrolase [Acidimicrobiales bacterium]|nr:HAD-IIA family hydrolase [Acidimicrobiales bacterium]